MLLGFSLPALDAPLWGRDPCGLAPLALHVYLCKGQCGEPSLLCIPGLPAVLLGREPCPHFLHWSPTGSADSGAFPLPGAWTGMGKDRLRVQEALGKHLVGSELWTPADPFMSSLMGLRTGDLFWHLGVNSLQEQGRRGERRPRHGGGHPSS